MAAVSTTARDASHRHELLVRRTAGPQRFQAYTYLGFRYFEVDAPGEKLGPPAVVAYARHAAMAR